MGAASASPMHPVADANLGEDAGGVLGVVAQLAGETAYGPSASGERRRQSSISPFRTAQTTISCFVPRPSVPFQGLAGLGVKGVAQLRWVVRVGAARIEAILLQPGYFG